MTTAGLESISLRLRQAAGQRVTVFIALLTTCVLGCSPEPEADIYPEPSARSGTDYVELSVSKGEWPSGEPTRVLLAAIPSESGELSAPWSTTLKGPVAVKAAAGRWIKVPKETRNQRVRLQLPEGTGRFDLASVVVTCEGRARIAAMARRDGVDVVEGDFQEIENLGEPTSLRFDLGQLAYRSDAPNEFDIALKGVRGTLRIHRVELFKRPIGLRLNAPEREPVYEAIGDDFRPCRTLLPGLELSGSWAGSASALEVDVASPNEGAACGSVRLVMEEGGVEFMSASITLTAGWETLSVSLPIGGDAERLVTVTTDAKDGAWIGVPRIRRSAAEPSQAPRHVLLITADTHRADHVGYAPNSVPVSTPTIDALAERGTCFLDAWSVTSITNPSHASILTGEPMTTTGVLGNLAVISERANMLAETFQRAGFRTFASISARHMTPPRSGFGQGFERFDGPQLLWTRDGAETILRAREMLAAAPNDDVFLWLHLFDVHAPYRVHDEFLDEYYEGDPYAKRAQAIAPEAVAAWNRKVQDASYYRALYKNEVTYLDQLLGRFFEENPRARNGWVALTADHGESLGENGQYWTHPTIYPSTVRVPLVFAGPGVGSGLSVDRSVMNLDVARTLLDLCGMDDAEFPGRSLFDEDASNVPRFTLAPSARSAGIESEGWYLMLQLEDHGYGSTGRAVRHAVELYDLRNDPDATQNLAEAEPERTRRMRGRLVQWLLTAPDGGVLVGAGVTDEEAEVDMAALGYAASDASTLSGALIDPECSCPQCLQFRNGD